MSIDQIQNGESGFSVRTKLNDLIDYTNTTSDLIYVDFGDVRIGSNAQLLIPNGISGSTSITGSLNVSNGITGSLFGTSSWAQFSSQALTASFLPVGTYNITSSWAVSSSRAISSSFTTSASFSTSASFANSASFALTSLAGGQNTQIQFNSGSRFSGSEYFRYRYSVNSLEQGNNVTAIGLYSHAEGVNTRTDGDGFISTTSNNNNIFTILNEYDNVTSSFNVGQYVGLYAEESFGYVVAQILGRNWNGTNTFVTTSFSYSVIDPASNVYIIPVEFANISTGTDLNFGGQHAEGYDTRAIGNSSHAEGISTKAIGPGSHAEGNSTRAIGANSHAEGIGTQAIGEYSHAEGSGTQAIGVASHAEGVNTRTDILGFQALTPDGTLQNITINSRYNNITNNFNIGQYVAFFVFDGSEYWTAKIVNKSWNGTNTIIITDSSVTGYQPASDLIIAPIEFPDAGDYSLKADYAHSEGNSTRAIGYGAHAEGASTQAIGDASHAEGSGTQAIGVASHAEGASTQAIGEASHAEGYNTIAAGLYQHVQGQFNIESSAQSAFIIGNGTNNSNRRNLVFASGSQFQITGSLRVTGSLIMSPSSSFILPLSASNSPTIGSAYWSGSFLFVYDGVRYRSSSFS